MIKSLVAIALLAAVGPALAQPGCPPPVVKVLWNNQEVPTSGAALAPKVTLVVSPSPACTDGAAYRFSGAELTLMRGRRPLLPTKLVHQPEVNLTALRGIAQPGDRIHVFVPYKNLIVVSAAGKQSSYPLPALTTEQQRGLGPNLVTDDSKGISFNWLLVQYQPH